MSVATVMPGKRAAGSSCVPRAAVYHRWQPERSVDWCGPGAGVVRRVVWSAKSVLQAVCNFRLLRVVNLCEHHTKAVLDLKLMVGWG